MTAFRPWLGISTRDWFINSDTPHPTRRGQDTGNCSFQHHPSPAPKQPEATRITRVLSVRRDLVRWPSRWLLAGGDGTLVSARGGGSQAGPGSQLACSHCAGSLVAS